MTRLDTPFRYKYACLACKRRKVQCSRIKPCLSCVKIGSQSYCYADKTELNLLKASKAGDNTQSQFSSLFTQKSSNNLYYLDESLQPISSTLAACTSLMEVHWNRVEVDKVHFDSIWVRVIAGQATNLDLAFIFSLLALAGASLTRGEAFAPSRADHTQHYQRVEELLPIARKLAVDQNRLTLAQVYLQIAVYKYCIHQYKEARQHLLDCICIMREYDIFPTDPMQSFTSTEDMVLKLRMGIYTMDMYISYRNKTLPLLTNDQDRLISDLRLLDDRSKKHIGNKEDVKFRMIRLKATFLHIKTSKFLLQDRLKLSKETALSNAVSLDKEIFDVLKDPVLTLPMTSKTIEQGINDTATARSVHMAVNARTFMNTMRRSLVQVLDEKCTTVCQSVIIQSAYSILQSIPFRITLLRSRWKLFIIPCASNCSADICHLESAMKTMYLALEDGLHLLSMPSDKNPAIGSSSTDQSTPETASTLNHTLVTNFVKHFDRLFSMIEYMGRIGPWTLACAAVIKDIPLYKTPACMTLRRGSVLDIESFLIHWWRIPTEASTVRDIQVRSRSVKDDQWHRANAINALLKTAYKECSSNYGTLNYGQLRRSARDKDLQRAFQLLYPTLLAW